MSNITGYAGTDKTTLVEPVTCQPHDRSRIIVDTKPVGEYLVAQNQVVQAGSKKNVIVVSSHSAMRGDYIVFETLATIANQGAFVLSTTSTTITVAQPFTAAPIAGDTYAIYRPINLRTNSNGQLTISGSVNATIVAPLATASPAISATGVVTRVVGSVDAIYGEFSTAYTYLPVGGFDSAAETLAALPLVNTATDVSVALSDGSGNSLLSATSSPVGTERGLIVRNIPSGTQTISGSVTISDGSGPVTVDGTVAATQSGTWNIGTVTTLTGITNALPAGTNNIGDVDVLSLPALPTGTNVIGGIFGDIAHDAADSGNPVKIGGKALTADPTAVATGDRVNALFDKLGKQVVLPNALLEKHGKATSASSITNTTSTSLVAATASVIRVITAITVSNMHASVATIVNILNGTTVVWHGPAAALGGGYSISGLHLVGTVNTAINVQCVTTGASVRASVEYFEIAG